MVIIPRHILLYLSLILIAENGELSFILWEVEIMWNILKKMAKNFFVYGHIIVFKELLERRLPGQRLDFVESIGDRIGLRVAGDDAAEDGKAHHRAGNQCQANNGRLFTNVI